MVRAEFVHLHNHTEYSLLDGACRITDDKDKPAELMQVIGKEFKMPALAITDHGNMYGAVEFYSACRESGIKPIIGCEAYVAPGSRFEKKSEKGGSAEHYHHLTLLAKDLTGYQNLMEMVSKGFLEGFYYKPRIDRELLEKHHTGIIALSGCLAGEVASALLKGKTDDAERIALSYRDLMGADNYYLEVMDNGMEDQKRIIPHLMELSEKTGIPLVATNDCHYLRQADAYDQDILLCIGTGKNVSDPGRMKFSSDQFYYRSPDEMKKIFSYIPEAIKNTLVIAEKSNLEISFDQLLLPNYPVPKGTTAEKFLEKLCREGLQKRYPSVNKEHEQRLAHELSIINRMGFAAYFLIVWDFIHYAKSQGIPVGPGRGSGAGSIVAYALGITDICPLHYGLLFERFLNPDRRSMPDLDIDFADTGRDRVIEYVINKYGAENCAQIITFGSMQARLVIRDVGRVMGFTPQETTRIANLIPPGANVYAALQTTPELRTLSQSDERVRQLLVTSQKLEGLKRHTGVHAAGMVIANERITKYSPLAKGAKDVITTQYDGNILPKLGLLKVDFLGLRTLTVIDDAVRLIREKTPAFDLEKAPLNDEATYKLFHNAKTLGVFQLESKGMRDLLRKLIPTTIEDIIALISLYRPGPMGAGMIDLFVGRKHGKKQVTYDHAVLEPIIKDTYGVILYQEQVMRIATDMAGFSAGQADGLRKAMSKKIPEEIEKQRDNFITGAGKNKIEKKLAEKVFDQIVQFGGYGFNKSHAAAYGMLSYRTAFLKANYPQEYMTALLNAEIGHSAVVKEDEESKIVGYIHDAESMGIPILPPDIQTSFEQFSREGAAIRFGLVAIKNVGAGAAESIVQARKLKGSFKNWEDFIGRIDSKATNRKALESLIKAGACDSFGKPYTAIRATLTAQLDSSIGRAASQQKDTAIGQGLLFDEAAIVTVAPTATPAAAPLTEHDALTQEKEVLGFYLSGHPLSPHQHDLLAYSQYRLDKLPPGAADPRSSPMVRLAGMIASAKKLVTKEKKEPYARFKLEDLHGEVEVVVFPKSYANGLARYIVPNTVVVVKGKLSGRDGSTEMLAEEIMSLDEAKQRLTPVIGTIRLKISTPGLEDELLEKIKSIVETHPGKSPVIIDVAVPGYGEYSIETAMTVAFTPPFTRDIEILLGEESWELSSK